jgi:hypothetical protein
VIINTPEAALEVPEGTFMLAYRGSIAHNMYAPGSDPNSIDDVDLIGFVIPDARYYRGLREWAEKLLVEILQRRIAGVSG